MTTRIIFLYCLCDEAVKAIGRKDDPQAKMSDAEIMTLAITAALFYGGNYTTTRLVFQSHRYFSSILGKSRFNKRLLSIPEEIWTYVLTLCDVCLRRQEDLECIVDSFPVPICKNARISRCKLVRGKEYHGYCSSKQCYFFGIKVHVIATSTGIPLEVLFTPGAESDIRAFRRLHLDLPDGSIIYADKAYTDYHYEDLLAGVGINLCAHRKKNAKRQHSYQQKHIQRYKRKRIETTFSCITRRMPRSIHAITLQGFTLKVMLFVLVYSFEQLYALGN